MATNRVFNTATQMTLAVPSGTVSGDPVALGQLTGVALTSRDADGEATVQVAEGVFELSVKGENGSGNVAVAAGDIIYFTLADTPKLNKKTTGAPFGFALAAVSSGATATIRVRQYR